MSFFKKNSKRGFTLIEILVVIAVIGILAILTVPVGVNFFMSQQQDVVLDEIKQTLRQAQIRSMSLSKDNSWGVKFKSSDYTLFKGSSYASRDTVFDEVFTLANGLSTGGINEIVFAKLTGIPSSTGTISLIQSGLTKNLDVNEIGRIDEE